MASQIATLSEVKEYLGFVNTSGDRDDMLQRLLDSATLMIERYTGLRFEPNPPFTGNPPADTAAPVTLPSIWVRQSNSAPRVRSIVSDPYATEAYPSDLINVEIPHARVITAVTVNDGATTLAPEGTNPPGAGYWTETDSRLYTPFIRRIGIVSPSLAPVFNVQVTGRFGIVPAPADIVDAVLTITARRYREKDAAYSDVVQLQDGAVASYFKQLPASVKAIVDSYCEIGI